MTIWGLKGDRPATINTPHTGMHSPASKTQIIIGSIMTDTSHDCRPIRREQIDAWLSFWGCLAGGGVLSASAICAIWRHATTRTELLVGVVTAALAAVLLAILAVLARRVHLTASAGNAPWKLRQLELLSHAVGLAGLIAVGRVLAANPPGIVAMVTDALIA